MNVTNKLVLDSVESLNRFCELKLPVKTAFRLAKLTKKVSELLETYNEVLAKLQKDHVEKDEEGNPRMLDDPNNPNVKRLIFTDPGAFNKAYNELLEIETEINFKKLDLEDLGNIEVTPTTLFQIDWLLED